MKAEKRPSHKFIAIESQNVERVVFKIFKYKPKNAVLNAKLTASRSGLYLGIGLLWIFTVDVMDPAPNFDEANQLEGVLTKVDLSPRSRHLLRVENDSESVEGVLIGRGAYLKTLEDSVGMRVVVWFYSEPTLFIVPETRIIEIALDGRHLKNDWLDARERKNSNWSLVFLVLGLIITINFYVQIGKIKEQEELGNANN